MRTRLLCLFIALAGAHPAASAEALTAKEMTAARKIYVAKCAKCHRFHEPANYADSDWRTWMEKMNKKSKLKGEEASLLTRYLDAYRAGQLPGKPQDKPKSTQSGFVPDGLFQGHAPQWGYSWQLSSRTNGHSVLSSAQAQAAQEVIDAVRTYLR